MFTPVGEFLDIHEEIVRFLCNLSIELFLVVAVQQKFNINIF